jgi:hypothetical protein
MRHAAVMLACLMNGVGVRSAPRWIFIFRTSDRGPLVTRRVGGLHVSSGCGKAVASVPKKLPTCPNGV